MPFAYFNDVIAGLDTTIPVVYQDYPQSTQADISAQSFLEIVDAGGIVLEATWPDGAKWHNPPTMIAGRVAQKGSNEPDPGWSSSGTG